jgi:hypothetical protein
LESLSAERLQRWFVKGGEEREGFGRLSPMKWSSALNATVQTDFASEGLRRMLQMPVSERAWRDDPANAGFG